MSERAAGAADPATPPGRAAEAGDVVRARLRSPGLTGAVFLAWVSLSPSLIPRTWWMTAFNLGVCLTYGYVLGSLLAWVGRRAARRIGLVVEVRALAARWLRRAWLGFLAVGTGLAWWRSVRLQDEIAGLVGVPAFPLRDQALGLVGGVVLFGLLILLGRGLVLLWRLLVRLLRPVLPGIVAAGLSVAIVAWLVAFVSNDVLYTRFLESATRQAAAVNAQTPPGRRPPRETTRSGGPGSPETWASLGRQGQGFVADAPRRARIEEVTRRPAKEPILVYAGKRDGRTLEHTADAVVAELHRTGAFERKALVVITPAGEGWIPQWHPAAISYVTDGDCAIASMQFSYLPSALAFFTELDTAQEAGRVLFERVADEVATLPPGRRPKLYAAGESLGAVGGQAAFTDARDMLARVDGAVWTGTPRLAPMWQELEARRRDGSPEIAPVIDDGRHIRFVAGRNNLLADFYGRPFGPWEHPRVVFAQYATDPVVWWSWDLLWKEPDWLRERASPLVARDMRWAPGATFWQIMSDAPRSVRVPGGQGHRYHEDLVPIWAAVVGRNPAADYGAIERAIRADYRIY